MTTRIVKGADTDIEIEWSKLPVLTEIDNWVLREMGKQECDSFFHNYAGCSCLSDLKYNTENWIREKREQLDELEEMMDALPDDVYDSYWLVDES